MREKKGMRKIYTVGKGGKAVEYRTIPLMPSEKAEVYARTFILSC
jgi:hypothetical protein